MNYERYEDPGEVGSWESVCSIEEIRECIGATIDKLSEQQQTIITRSVMKYVMIIRKGS
jgi:hypothetical protein